MADPLSADRLLSALRTEGVRVREYRDWRSHNRNHKGRWGPVHGVMIHHTVTTGTAHSVDLCYRGYAGLPGPLCHGVIDKGGTVHLVGHGRANHAGSGDDDVLRAVIAERASLPPDNETNTDGNARFYGFECINLGDGRDPWPAAQLEAVARAAAGICRAHGWNERSVIGHAEWQPGKIDPRGPGKSAAVMMREIRARVAQLLRDGGPDGTPPPPVVEQPAPAPTPAPKRDDAPPRYRATIGGLEYGYGAYGEHVEQVDRALIREGCDRYHDGDGYQAGPRWTDYTTRNYGLWQERCGYSGADADGVPGEASLRRLLGSLPGRGGAAARPVVDLSRLIAAARQDPPKRGTPVTYSGVRTVEAALVAEGLLDARYADGHYGTKTRTAYSRWQQRCGYQGTYPGGAADGVPGMSSLRRLGQAHGFDVRS